MAASPIRWPPRPPTRWTCRGGSRPRPSAPSGPRACSPHWSRGRSAGWARRYSEVSEGLVALGKECASSAMVMAMHHIQVASLVRHGRNDLLRNYLVELVDRQYLLASATTEVGTGGDVGQQRVRRRRGRRHVPAGEAGAGHLVRGRFADGILVTARRSADSPENDQVLVLCRPPGTRTGAGRGVERPRVPGYLQPRVRPAGQRGRRRHPRRHLRRHLQPDHAAGGPPAVELAVARDRHLGHSTAPGGSSRPRPASVRA